MGWSTRDRPEDEPLVVEERAGRRPPRGQAARRSPPRRTTAASAASTAILRRTPHRDAVAAAEPGAQAGGEAEQHRDDDERLGHGERRPEQRRAGRCRSPPRHGVPRPPPGQGPARRRNRLGSPVALGGRPLERSLGRPARPRRSVGFVVGVGRRADGDGARVGGPRSTYRLRSREPPEPRPAAHRPDRRLPGGRGPVAGASAGDSAARALEATVQADPTLRERLGETGLRHLLRDTEAWIEASPSAVERRPGAMHALRRPGRGALPPPQRPDGRPDPPRRGLPRRAPAVLRPDEQASADVALDQAIEVFRWHRRLAGDARKRNRLLQAIYKGA